MDSDASLRWRVCPALEFCTVGVEVFALFFFFLCVWSLEGLQGICYSGAG